jgi:Tol biopolymer transport system component
MTTRTLGYILACIFGATVAVAGCATSSPGAEKEAKPVELENLKTVGGKANGLVVWTSSRTGRPHLFTMRTDGADTKQLTKGPATDWHPRFSPDGSKILFSRSRAKGFVRESQANDDDTWDLYTVSAGGDDIDKVVENATWGNWIGPDEILFMRGSKVLRTKLGSGEETKIMDTARYPIFAGAIVQQPELSPDGHLLALTLAGNRLQTGIWSIKHKTWTPIGMGAELAWAPDGASVYWVDADGNGFARILHETVTGGAPPEKVEPADLVLVDLKGKRTREAFPRLSNDGKWLVFGSAIHDLEHDLEDYEIYLWELGSSSDSATRLTFHSANDRWPDVFVGEPGKAAPPVEPKAGANDEPKAEEDGADKPVAAEPAAKLAPAPETTPEITKPATTKPAPTKAAGSSDDSTDDSNDWDDSPKTAATKTAATKTAPKTLKEDEPAAAPASGDEDAASADETSATTTKATKATKKHKKKKRR